jgi:hypothetical protein
MVSFVIRMKDKELIGNVAMMTLNGRTVFTRSETDPKS